MSGGHWTLYQVIRNATLVFVSIPDPIANGFVVRLAHPGGNTHAEHGPQPLKQTRP
jgi:hypothetical protein